jgi:hypothetical protein
MDTRPHGSLSKRTLPGNDTMRLLLGLFALSLFAQDGAIVQVSAGAPPLGYTQVLGVDTNLPYICLARSYQGPNTPRSRIVVAISGVSKANPAVVTSTGHGFPVVSSSANRPSITISGATGTGWTGINAAWTATVIDANTFSIPINSVGFGTLAGTVTFTTTAPRTTVAEWAVKKLGYDGSNNLIWVGWLGGNSGYSAKCSDATLTTNNQQ